MRAVSWARAMYVAWMETMLYADQLWKHSSTVSGKYRQIGCWSLQERANVQITNLINMNVPSWVKHQRFRFRYGFL